MIRLFPLAFAAGLIAVAGAASANPTLVVKPVFNPDNAHRTQATAVGLSDLDLSSASGARVALDRIQQAATAVCGGMPEANDPVDDKEDFATCRADAIRSATREVKAPVLTALVDTQPRALVARN